MTNCTDVLIIEEEDIPKPKVKPEPKFKVLSKKKGEVEESESSEDSDGSLSTDTEESSAEELVEEDFGEEHNLAAVKPIAAFGVQVTDGKLKARNAKRKLKKKLTRAERTAQFKKRKELLKLGMVKPDIVADRERERKFVHIATKGVVQLFNKVAERQAELKKEEELAGKQKAMTKARIKDEKPGPPPLAKLLNIRVPLGPPPSKKIKPEVKEIHDHDDSEVVLDETDTDGGVIQSEADIKTEPESESD
uniref:RRP15-like protein n=1 Tax=Panagrolaimus sp. JU765 TaxID=591449 RepID=A0AC34RCV1_9BILA